MLRRLDVDISHGGPEWNRGLCVCVCVRACERDINTALGLASHTECLVFPYQHHSIYIPSLYSSIADVVSSYA
jgi:hypothetical protein